MNTRDSGQPKTNGRPMSTWAQIIAAIAAIIAVSIALYSNFGGAPAPSESSPPAAHASVSFTYDPHSTDARQRFSELLGPDHLSEFDSHRGARAINIVLDAQAAWRVDITARAASTSVNRVVLSASPLTAETPVSQIRCGEGGQLRSTGELLWIARHTPACTPVRLDVAETLSFYIRASDLYWLALAMKDSPQSITSLHLTVLTDNESQAAITSVEAPAEMVSQLRWLAAKWGDVYESGGFYVSDARKAIESCKPK